MEDKQKSQETPQESALDSSLSWLQRLKDNLVESFDKLTNLEQTNFQLGVKYMNEGAFKDASLRFRIVLWLNAKNEYANYMLGKAYVYNEQYEKAVPPLKKALAARPELEEAKFFLAVCGLGEVPHRVPPSLMIENLENISEIYEEQIANGINMQSYRLGNKMLAEHLEGQQGFDFLDLDIRTGRSGDLILPISNNIVGVEPAMNMIAQARNRRVEDKLVYNELITKTSQDCLTKEERKFDVVQAYFSSLFIGGLQPFFELVARRMKGRNLFLLSVEGKEGESFLFNRSKMSFQHSASYIIGLAEKTGFEVIASKKADTQNPASDIVFLLKKKD